MINSTDSAETWKTREERPEYSFIWGQKSPSSIATIRYGAGLSQRALSEKLGWPQFKVARLEDEAYFNKGKFPLSVLVSYTHACGMKLSLSFDKKDGKKEKFEFPVS